MSVGNISEKHWKFPLVSKSINKNLLTFFLQEEKSICFIFSKGFCCFQALCILMQLPGRFFYAACKIFQTYEKNIICNSRLGQPTESSNVAGRTDIAARPARSHCKSSRGRWEELTSVPPAWWLPESLAKLGDSPGRAQKTFLLRLHILVRYYPLKESAFSTRKPISWNISKKLQYPAESFMFFYPSSS